MQLSHLEGARVQPGKHSHWGLIPPSQKLSGKGFELPLPPSSRRSRITTAPGMGTATSQERSKNCGGSGQVITCQQVKNTHLLHAFVQNAGDSCGESNTNDSFLQKAQSLVGK